MPERFKLLDPLRLMAVLVVLLFHYAYRGAIADGFTQLSVPDWHPVAQYGYLGVHLFFVISGFVIALSAHGRTPTAFVVARFTRIYPGFLVCMTISFVVLRLFGPPVFNVTLKQWAANLVIMSPFLHQPFMDGAYWSIVYEIIFYGWVTLLLARGTLFRHANVIALCWVAISVANEYLGPSVAVRRLFLTDASGFFLAGITLHRLHVQGSTLWSWLILALAAELAAGQAVIISRYNALHYGADLSKPVIVVVALGAIVLVGLCARVRRSVLPQGLALAVGGLTYPLYLLHQNIGFVVFNAVDGAVPPKLLLAGTALVLIAVALFVYLVVERPAQAWLRRLLKSPRIAWPAFARPLPRP